MDRYKIGIIIMLVISLLAVIATIGRGAFANPDIAHRVLKTQGFTDIKVISHHWFLWGKSDCGRDFAARFHAQATNPLGKKVEIDICTGVSSGGAILVE